MKFTSIWTANARDLIRDILIYDINNDNKFEVVYASWDGNIYAVQGNSGTRLWTVKSNVYSGPAEKLLKIKISLKKPFIAATKHKYLLIIDGETGNVEFAENFGSWIKEAKSCDFDCDGRSEIAILTRKNELYVIDDNGEIIFRKNLENDKVLHHIALSTFKDCKCPSLLASNSGLVPVLHHLDTFLTETKFDAPILAISNGRILPDLTFSEVVGLKNAIQIISNDGPSIKFKDSSLLPYIIKTGDIDGDLQEEIIVGDWYRDSILILKHKSKILAKLFEINLGGNPISLESADIDGDGKDEILALTDSSENNFMIIDPYKKNKIVFSSDTYPASMGLKVGNVLGYGFGDIIYRSSREKISLLIHVPRIDAPRIIKEGEEFYINLITQSKDRLIGTRGMEISTKKIDVTRTKLGLGWVTMSRMLAKCLTHGISWLRLQRGGKNILQRQIIVASNRKIDTSTIAVYSFEEDLLKAARRIQKILIPNNKSNIISIKKTKSDLIYYISNTSNYFVRPQVVMKLEDKEIKQQIIFIKDQSLEYELSDEYYYSYRDKLTLAIKNLSQVSLQITFIGDEVIGVPPDPIILSPKSTKKINLDIIYQPDNFVEHLKSSLKIIYKGSNPHCIQIPLELGIINKTRVKSLVEEILSVKKNIKQAIRETSERIDLPFDVISRIVKIRK